jgi:hypothetical protein
MNRVCPNDVGNPDCKINKSLVSERCMSCRHYTRRGKSFEDLYGSERAKEFAINQRNAMLTFLDKNPEKRDARVQRCLKNAKFYDKWVEKYGVEEADKRKSEWYAKTPKFKAGESNPNNFPHVKAKHLAAVKKRWKDEGYAHKMSQMMMGNKFNLGNKHSVETKTKMRLAAVEQILKKRRPGFTPNYNKKACKYFNHLMIHDGINIQHAENGGEFFIKELGYWVDGYDKHNNVVYEFDEKSHQLGNKPAKDAERQALIEQHLGCKFIRIKYNQAW